MLCEALKTAIKPLEDVPEDAKDWHPRSNGLVLDLVHPSLYPLVYGRSMVHWRFATRGEAVMFAIRTYYSDAYEALHMPGFRSKSSWTTLPKNAKSWSADHLLHWLTETRVEDVVDELWVAKAQIALQSMNKGYFKKILPALEQHAQYRGLQVAQPPTGTDTTSARFAWLPTDFLVGASGVKALGYINNIPASDAALVSAVESIVGAFVPLFERVLTDLLPENRIPLRVPDEYEREETDKPKRENYETLEAYDAAYDDWYENGRPIVFPVPGEYAGTLQHRSKEFSLRGRKIQVIVKLANIILVRPERGCACSYTDAYSPQTPETPNYPGGSWHVEGMSNEKIVASGIYYYDEEFVRCHFLVIALMSTTGTLGRAD